MSEWTFRRCHHCDTLIEANTADVGEQITRCDGCGKHLAPFYFFNHSDVPTYSDGLLRPEATIAVMRGFATAWTVDEAAPSHR